MFDFFKSKKPPVIRHWYSLISGFNNSTQEFYAAVETELKSRQVPGLEVSRVDFTEAGPLSDKRTYLRMTRERLIFDICAAPFGTAYFFSCRFAEIPAVIEFWQLLILAALVPFCGLVSFLICLRIFGLFAPFVWPVGVIGFVIAAIYVMRNANMVGPNLDATLLRIPVINAVYEAWFRKETYYRQDTRLMYCDTVDEVVKAKIEEVTSAKGFKLLRYNDYNPILGDLYKPTTVKRAEPTPPT